MTMSAAVETPAVAPACSIPQQQLRIYSWPSGFCPYDPLCAMSVCILQIFWEFPLHFLVRLRSPPSQLSCVGQPAPGGAPEGPATRLQWTCGRQNGRT